MKSPFVYTICSFLCAVFIIGSASFSFASDDPAATKPHHCITRNENGIINWTTGEITAVGKASPQINRAFSQESVPGSARADASRQLINILKQLKINPALSVEAHAAKNDIILAGIEETARDATILRQYYTSDLSVEITVKTSVLGGFLQLVLPEEIRQIPKINPEQNFKTISMNGRKMRTGMIIDARGLGIEPVLNPVIISEQGDDIYSDVFISREFAVKNGVCRYICNMEEALNDRRIGNNPLILKALRKEGKENSAIVISMSDYVVLEKTTERHTFLKECRVTIVKDQ